MYVERIGKVLLSSNLLIPDGEKRKGKYFPQHSYYLVEKSGKVTLYTWGEKRKGFTFPRYSWYRWENGSLSSNNR
jgi:hypothetical protein